jgi:hypothetical protein
MKKLWYHLFEAGSHFIIGTIFGRREQMHSGVDKLSYTFKYQSMGPTCRQCPTNVMRADSATAK